MTAQFYKFTHNHPILLLQWVKSEIWTIYLNKAIKKKRELDKVNTDNCFTESSINDKRNEVVAARVSKVKRLFLSDERNYNMLLCYWQWSRKGKTGRTAGRMSLRRQEGMGSKEQLVGMTFKGGKDS